LIELLTEELPPKALEKLSLAFADEIFSALKEQALTGANSVCTPFATPRRLALTITNVDAMQENRVMERKGPAVNAGLNADGSPTKALEGFMRSANVTFDKLLRVKDGKAEYFAVKIEQPGKPLDDYLADIIALAVKKLPVPKLMRWGDTEFQFVRPVHALTVLHGSRVIFVELFGLQSGNVTRGHRFLSPETIRLRTRNNLKPCWKTRGMWCRV
jgi:glycyl-tRNA synthetase beta chain